MADFPPIGAPLANRWERLDDEWPVTEGPEFPDGGRDYFSPVLANPIRRWRVIYQNKPTADIALLDTWNAANRGSGLTFNFTDRDATVYGGVRCVRYQRSHGRLWNHQTRIIEFEDRP